MPLTAFSQPPLRQSVRGFSLIEVMVTIVIVSFGLLGLAGLLFSSVTAGQTSMSRTVAVDLANEMGDRIRANWKAVKAGSFDAVAVKSTADLAAACPTTCMSGQCTPADQATLDVCLWQAQVSKQLPGGQACIIASPDPTLAPDPDPCKPVNPLNLKCADTTKACSFRVTVLWNENAYSTGAAASQLFQNAQTSYSVSVQP